MPTEIYNRVTIDEQDYLIKKMTAKEGLKIARMILAKAAPLIKYLDRDASDGKINDSMFDVVGRALESFSDEDVDVLIDRCLRVCYLSTPAGQQPVMDEYGNYGVVDIEYDMGLIMKLCFEAIKWGASDFFEESSSISNLFRKLAG